MQSHLSHPVISGISWISGFSGICRVSSVPGWSGQAKVALVPLPVYPKTYKKPVQVSHAAGVLQKPHTHFSRQEGSHKYAGGFSDPSHFHLSLFEHNPPLITLHLLQLHFSQTHKDFPAQELSDQDSVFVISVIRVGRGNKGRVRVKAAKFFLL